MMAMQMMAQELEVNTSELAGRELEAAVLNKAASLLEEVVGHWHDDADHALLDNALKYNQTLWSVFQAELLNEDNPLPVGIKQNILGLANFIFNHTFKLAADPQPQGLGILININRDIAAGLRGR